MDTKTQKILVYGTLKRSQPNYYLAKQPPGNIIYKGRAITTDRWPLVVAGPFRVPYLLDVKGVGKHIYGEVFELDEAKLAIFDKLERHPHMYTRMPIEVKLITGPDDKPLESEADPEMIEAYLIQNPKKTLMDLPLLDDYDVNKPISAGYILPSNRRQGAWDISDIKEVE